MESNSELSSSSVSHPRKSHHRSHHRRKGGERKSRHQHDDPSSHRTSSVDRSAYDDQQQLLPVVSKPPAAALSLNTSTISNASTASFSAISPSHVPHSPRVGNARLFDGYFPARGGTNVPSGAVTSGIITPVIDMRSPRKGGQIAPSAHSSGSANASLLVGSQTSLSRNSSFNNASSLYHAKATIFSHMLFITLTLRIHQLYSMTVLMRSS